MNDNKLARICWNSNSWEKPSGLRGKSKTDWAYESMNGFGHEEWLFDFKRLIDGYHYSYLTPIRKNYEAYCEEYFNILLFTINSETKKQYLVGWINNIYVIPSNEAENIYSIYEKNNWINEMKDEIRLVNANDEFKNANNENKIVFNIRFLPKDVQMINGKCLQLISNEEKINPCRYDLYYLYKHPKIELLGKR